MVDVYKKMILEGGCKNIEFVDIDKSNLEELYNTHGTHLCLSERYVAEAKSCKAVVLYADDQPVNETFSNGVDGVSIPCSTGVCQVEEVEQSVNQLLEISVQNRVKIGNNARNRFLKSDTEFEYRLLNYLKGQRPIEKIIHQVWLSKNDEYEDVQAPEKYKKYIRAWKEYNPDFVYKFWSGREILNLIKTYFPQYEDYYRSLTLL